MIGTALARRYRTSRPVERASYLLAATLFASGVIHLVLLAVLGGPWSGPVSLRKAADFGGAFGLTLLAVTWASGFVTMRARVHDRLLAAFALACAVEVAAISIQAWRGVPSHFNTSTPTNAAFAFSAAGGGAVIIVVGVAFTVAALRRDELVPRELRLAVVTGFASLLVALGIGAAMIAIGTTVTRTDSLTAGYDAAIRLVPGHAAAMQGILVLPPLAWLTAFTDWPTARRVRITALACAGFSLCASVIVLESLLRINPLALADAPIAGTSLALVGAAALVAAAVTVVRGVFAGSASTTPVGDVAG
ncbi:MAG: hypothetical protein J2O49_02300 [Sciscionella sp.]|nr:hypothetical protein [Sciscionella sp.]